jgi:hypothetical protein
VLSGFQWNLQADSGVDAVRPVEEETKSIAVAGPVGCG